MSQNPLYNGQPTAPGYDPTLHVGTTGAPPDLRNITRAEYEALGEEDRLKVALLAEELQVGKEMRQTGEVQVSKRVVEEQVSVPVTLEHEEVTVTRHKVDQPLDATRQGDAFQDKTLTVALKEEVPVVSKVAHVVEEVEIAKTKVAQQQTVSDTVRHEEVDINAPQNLTVQGDTATS